MDASPLLSSVASLGASSDAGSAGVSVDSPSAFSPSLPASEASWFGASSGAASASFSGTADSAVTFAVSVASACS